MKIKSMTMGIMILVILIIGIGTTMGMNLWVTTSEKVPAKFEEEGLAGVNNPADIRGSYTFGEVADLFEIDLKILYQAFNIPEGTDGTTIKTKDLEAMVGNTDAEIGNGSVRIFVALYNNLPIELDGSYLLKPGTALILENNKNLTEEQRVYLETHTAGF